MAITGSLLLFFVIGHLVGNLQLFLGAEIFNDYAAFLKGLGGLLWIMRLGLLAVFMLHVVTAIQLSNINRAARPVGYADQATLKATTSSLYMVETGLIILVFVVIHLLHFTLMTLHPEYAHLVDSKGRHDVYKMVVLGFQSVPYAAIYILSMLMLGVHLSHGVASVFQTLGFYHKYFHSRIKVISSFIGWGIALGYITIPIAVQLGLIGGVAQ